jgi:hypothetical protein
MKQFILIFSILALSLLASQSFAGSDLRLLMEVRNRAVIEKNYRDQLHDNGISLKPLPVEHMAEASRQFIWDIKTDVQIAVVRLITVAKITGVEKNRPASELVNEVLRTIDDSSLELLIKKANEKIESAGQQKTALKTKTHATAYFAKIESKSGKEFIGKWSGLRED